MSDSIIRTRDLKKLLADAGHQHLLKAKELIEEDSVLAEGALAFHDVNAQIGVHYCDMIESNSGSSSVEIAPSLNITILFTGKVAFSVGSNYYEIEAEDRPLVFANIVTGREIFSRHMSKGQQVRKLTLSLSQDWLTSRVEGMHDPMSELLSDKSQVIKIHAGTDLVEDAYELLELQQKDLTFREKLTAEMLTFSILNQSVPSLISGEPVSYANQYTSDSEVKKSLQLRKQVEQLSLSHSSLQDIANALNISPSTLQRKFKSAFRVTVQEHIRIKRLEDARKSLLVDGLSIGEVAYAAGYKHVANFVTAFKKQFGLTPSELRRKHLN